MQGILESLHASIANFGLKHLHPRTTSHVITPQDLCKAAKDRGWCEGDCNCCVWKHKMDDSTK